MVDLRQLSSWVPEQQSSIALLQVTCIFFLKKKEEQKNKYSESKKLQMPNDESIVFSPKTWIKHEKRPRQHA